MSLWFHSLTTTVITNRKLKIHGSAVLKKGKQNLIAIAIVISNRSLIWCAAIQIKMCTYIIYNIVIYIYINNSIFLKSCWTLQSTLHSIYCIGWQFYVLFTSKNLSQKLPLSLYTRKIQPAGKVMSATPRKEPLVITCLGQWCGVLELPSLKLTVCPWKSPSFLVNIIKMLDFPWLC